MTLSFFASSSPLQAKVFRHSAGPSAIPTLDIEAGCGDVSHMSGVGKVVNYSSCIAEERTARAQLENE
jgi:hypothetical protein